MKSSVLPVLLVTLCVIAIISMLSYVFFFTNHIQSNNSASQEISPAVPVKDFAPNLPESQKTVILIRLSDSSEEKYLVPADQVNIYIKNLPQGYHVISKSP